MRSTQKELIAQAAIAYNRSAQKRRRKVSQPDMSLCSVEAHDGKDYVVLRNAHGILAIYQICENDLLRRFPKDRTTAIADIEKLIKEAKMVGAF